MRAIIDGLVWRPYSELTEHQRAALRSRLTLTPKQTSEHSKEIKPIHMFVEDDRAQMFGMPREFYAENRKLQLDEVLRVSDGAPLSARIRSQITHDGPYAEQGQAVDRLVQLLQSRPWGGTTFKAGCGSGKTVVGLSVARRIGRRTLILTHKEFLMDQWVERIGEHLPGATVGIVRQKKCEFEGCDFTVAMLGSLASKQAYPPEFYRAFGLLIFDELHRMGAETWAPIPQQFAARYRLGLSATPRRKDGTGDVFWNHIGRVGYAYRTEPLVPQLRKIVVESELRGRMDSSGRIRDASKLGSTEIVTQLTNLDSRTQAIAEDVLEAVVRGRKIMVMGERLEHLRQIAEALSNLLQEKQLNFTPVIDFYVGDWFTGEVDERGTPKKRRRTRQELKRAESANVIFATAQMASEGLDVQALDVLWVATPVSDIEQSVGRVRRPCMPREDKCARLCPWRAGECQGKPVPVVTDMIDANIPAAITKWKSRLRFYARIGMVQNGREERL